MFFPDRAIAEIETLLLEPGCFHGHSQAQPTTTSAIATPASEDFSDFRFLCCSPQVILLKNGGIPDGGHHLQETCPLMADLEGVF